MVDVQIRIYCIIPIILVFFMLFKMFVQCFSKSLPSCLKKALVDKFKQFTEYQLAKYNTRKHRCKHNKKRKKGEVICQKALNI